MGPTMAAPKSVPITPGSTTTTAIPNGASSRRSGTPGMADTIEQPPCLLQRWSLTEC